MKIPAPKASTLLISFMFSLDDDRGAESMPEFDGPIAPQGTRVVSYATSVAMRPQSSATT